MEADATHTGLLGDRGKRLPLGGSRGLPKGNLCKGPIPVWEDGPERGARRPTLPMPDWPRPATPASPGGKAYFRCRPFCSCPFNIALGVQRVYTGSVREFDEGEIMFWKAAANLSASPLVNAGTGAALERDYDPLIKNQERLYDN